MKIALAQQNYTVGDIEGNTLRIIDAINRAKNEGADLVVFAEQAISGVPAFDLLRKSTFLELCEDAMVQIASCCDGIAAIVGLPMHSSKGTVSTAAVIQDRKVTKYISKRNITARREMGFLVPGRGSDSINIGGHKILIVVGNDINKIKDVDPSVDTIISINSRKYAKGLLSYRFSTLRALSYVEQKNVVIINQVGGNSEIVYDGSSCVFNPKGELMFLMKSFEEDFKIHDLEIEESGATVPPLSSNNHRMPLVYKAAVMGLRDYFYKNDYKKACVRLSGGIDSAVTATLAVEALGKENVVAFTMPSATTSEGSVNDAKEMAANLGIEHNIIPIKDIYESTIKSMAQFSDGIYDVSDENILERIRTIILMGYQNKKGPILINSTNKSETALGLCTLYGDTAGAFCPTGDLYKSEVYDLARYINKISNDVIPDNILLKEPTSELHPEKLIETPLPPYEVVDAILYRMIELEQHREEVINAGFDSDVVENIHSMLLQNAKKRYQYPPVLRLSTCAFGHERLMPLTNKYGD
ncbi:MAG: NAD(+) synthase [Rikenellaceae bacterium]